MQEPNDPRKKSLMNTNSRKSRRRGEDLIQGMWIGS
jgi:hypothetical protein